MQIGFLVCAANVFVWEAAQRDFLRFAPQAGPSACFCWWSGFYAEALDLVSDGGTSFRVGGCESVQLMGKRPVCCVVLGWQLLRQVEAQVQGAPIQMSSSRHPAPTQP